MSSETIKIYVSITCISQHQQALYECLDSIKNQSVKPDACYVYLSQEPYLLDAGFETCEIQCEDLANLIENNDMFRLNWVENTGPYRKLLPLLQNKWNENCLIITIDADTVYHPDLVKDLVADYHREKCCVGNRCWEINLDNPLKTVYKTGILPSDDKQINNFHTGKGGVLYSPEFFRKVEDIIFDKTLYTKLCATGDDIWFNMLRVANNTPCSVGSRSYPYVRHKRNGKYLLYDQGSKTRSLALWTNYNCRTKNTRDLKSTLKFLLDNNYLGGII